MVICHLCLNGPYNEGWSYQENIIPKYQVKDGHTVYQIVAPCMWKDNKIVPCDPERYENAHGVTVIRGRIKRFPVGGTRFYKYPDLFDLLCEIKPDVLFIHDVQCLDMTVVRKYLKKHRECVAFADNHSDFFNSAKNWLSRNVLHKIVWRRMAHIVEPYIKKFYGVTPARVDFLTDVYKLPKEKTELLPLGADDDVAELALSSSAREKKRSEYSLGENDFVIVTGGKIDHNKPQTITFMRAVNELGDPNVKLLVFGSVSEEYRSEFDSLLSDKVKYVGWKGADEIYCEFAVADLIVFPGLHSVLWEQAAGMGKPCIFKDIQGFRHIDLGGNCLFFENDTVEEYLLKIQTAKNNIDKMKTVAEEKGKKVFSYREISRRSIKID